MPRETFPEKKPGDSLSARHINDLSRVARQASSFFATSGISTVGGHPTVGVQPHIRLVIVTRANEVDSAAEESSASSSSSSSSSGSDTHDWDCETANYEVYGRYFDVDDEEWKTDDDDGPYCLDDAEFDDTLAVGDVVQARWDPQRGMFVRVGGGSSGGEAIRWGKAISSENAGKVLEVELLEKSLTAIDVRGDPTGENISCVTIHACVKNGRGLIFPIPSFAVNSDSPPYAYSPLNRHYRVIAVNDWDAGSAVLVRITSGFDEVDEEIEAIAPWISGDGRAGTPGVIVDLSGTEQDWLFLPTACGPITDPENLESSSDSSS